MKTQPTNLWLQTGRILLILYSVALTILAITGIVMFPGYAQSHITEFPPNNNWTPDLVQAALRQLGWPAVVPAYVSLVTFVLMAIIGGGVGFLILWRAPKGWFFLYLAFTFINFLAPEIFIRPLLPYLPSLNYLNKILGPAGWQFYFILMYFFPNGKAVPGWTRWVALTWFVIIILSLIYGDRFFLDGTGIFYILVFSAILSQIYRYFWWSDPIQRQQTKWMIAVVLLMLAYILGIAFWVFSLPSGSGEDLGWQFVVSVLNSFLFPMILTTFPVVIAIAVFRYHLWDIDLVIRRTIAYGLLTFLLGLVYYGLITVLQGLSNGLSQQDSPLIIVLSTLAIAALFNPLRRRLQSAIDRRFFRLGYDTERVTGEFSASLQNEVDVETLRQNLMHTVSKTIQPETAGLWIRRR